MRRPPGLVPFALFAALLAGGFLVAGKRGAPHAEDDGCPEHSARPPNPAPRTLLPLEDELMRGIALSLGPDEKLAPDREKAVRAEIRKGLEDLEKAWNGGVRPDLEAGLEEVYSATRAAVASHLTESQRRRLYSHAPVRPRGR